MDTWEAVNQSVAFVLSTRDKASVRSVGIQTITSVFGALRRSRGIQQRCVLMRLVFLFPDKDLTPLLLSSLIPHVTNKSSLFLDRFKKKHKKLLSVEAEAAMMKIDV